MLVALFLGSLALTLGAAVPVGATHEPGWCAQSAGVVPIGTGETGTGLPVLAGINHVDIPFDECSNGLLWLDHESDTFSFETFCSEGFVRVWAGAGTTGSQVIINWVSSGQGSC